MTAQNYPWRETRMIGEALSAVGPVFAELGVIAWAGGCAESEIAAAEGRMGRALPGDVRAFYRAMRPLELFDGGDGRREFGIYPLESKELEWRSMEEAEPAEDWASATGLALGQSVFGDPFWWVEGHRTIPEGGIVLLNHGGGVHGDLMFVYYARSFCEFLGKVAHYRNLYPPAGDTLFRHEYLELNFPAAM